MEIDWYPSVWEARRQAAAEGKPIFLMAGSGDSPTDRIPPGGNGAYVTTGTGYFPSAE